MNCVLMVFISRDEILASAAMIADVHAETDYVRYIFLKTLDSFVTA